MVNPYRENLHLIAAEVNRLTREHLDVVDYSSSTDWDDPYATINPVLADNPFAMQTEIDENVEDIMKEATDAANPEDL